MQSRHSYLRDHEIPEFTLVKGTMIRFWVEIVSAADYDTCFGMSAMHEMVKILDKNAKLCSNNIERKLVDFLSPTSTGKYLSRNFNLKEEEIEKMLSYFNINQEWKVKNLGFAHQKVFSIICAFQKYQVIPFDYFGLSPNTVEQLTEFVITELKKGKTAISFDNLIYKPRDLDFRRIQNLEIRVKKRPTN